MHTRVALRTKRRRTLKINMQQLVEICPESRDALYSAQREFLLRLFDQAKCTISRNLFGVEGQAVEPQTCSVKTMARRPSGSV